MILAAAEHAYNPSECEPPPELLLYWRCEEHGALPDAGGVRDQNAMTMLYMRQAYQTWNIARQFKAAPKAFSERDPNGFAFILKVDAALRERTAQIESENGQDH